MMFGPHPHDIATVRPKVEIPLTLDTNLRGWRIAYSIDLDYVERGRAVRLADYFESLKVCGEMYESFGPLMERYRIFVCPTITTTRINADFNYVSDEIEINGKRVEPELSVAMCHQFNMISRCPVLSVPSGISANRVPTGVQLVGRTFDDESVFRAAAALEAARPLFCSASDRPVL